MSTRLSEAGSGIDIVGQVKLLDEENEKLGAEYQAFTNDELEKCSIT